MYVCTYVCMQSLSSCGASVEVLVMSAYHPVGVHPCVWHWTGRYKSLCTITTTSSSPPRKPCRRWKHCFQHGWWHGVCQVRVIVWYVEVRMYVCVLLYVCMYVCTADFLLSSSTMELSCMCLCMRTYFSADQDPQVYVWISDCLSVGGRNKMETVAGWLRAWPFGLRCGAKSSCPCLVPGALGSFALLSGCSPG